MDQRLADVGEALLLRWRRQAAIAPARFCAQLSDMPVMYDFVHDVLFLSAVGASKHGDAASALHAALADPARPVPLRGLVFDARLSTSIAQRTSGQIRGIAEAIASNAVALGGRVALIGESDLTFGLLRIGDAYMQCAGLDSRVFRDASDAAEWLAASSGED